MENTFFKTACARQIGTMHKHSGTPCQDSTSAYSTENVSCIVLADGAGSYSLAHLASVPITDAVSKYVAENFEELYRFDESSFKKAIIKTAFDAVPDGIRPYCTLLLFAKNSEGNSILLHIGDGAIFGTNADREKALLSAPENGGAKNITFFVDDYNAEEHIRVQKNISQQYDTIIMCSDGSTEALLEEATGKIANAVGIIGNMVYGLPKDIAERYLSEDLDNLFRLKTHDDMSIAVLCPSKR